MDQNRKYTLMLGVILSLILVYGCSKLTKSDPQKKSAAIPVLTAPIVQKNMPIFITALGSVTPINTVTVRTQIDGQLLRVHFKDGQMIQAGDLLAEIDPRPYQAQLIQYQGQLVRDRALLANAQIDLARYKTLFAQDSISQQTLATQESLVQQYQGAIKTDQGQIEAVKVNLIYCNIIAPISGRLGLIEVDPGNVVQTTDANGIVIINTLSPIYVDFSIPEDDLPEVATKIAAGVQLVTYAQDRAQNKTLATGTLLTTDNQINTSTGTITLRAQFDNEQNILFPNQFVNIQLQVDELKSATVVPIAAVQYGVNGKYIYVVNSDNTVTMQPIEVLATVGNDVAIVGKVKPGQAVVIEGVDKLKNGSEVTIANDMQNRGKNNESV